MVRSKVGKGGSLRGLHTRVYSVLWSAPLPPNERAPTGLKFLYGVLPRFRGVRHCLVRCLVRVGVWLRGVAWIFFGLSRLCGRGELANAQHPKCDSTNTCGFRFEFSWIFPGWKINALVFGTRRITSVVRRFEIRTPDCCQACLGAAVWSGIWSGYRLCLPCPSKPARSVRRLWHLKSKRRSTCLVLLRLPAVFQLAHSDRSIDLARPHLPGRPRPVQAIYFDKSPLANWSVAPRVKCYSCARCCCTHRVDLWAFGTAAYCTLNTQVVNFPVDWNGMITVESSGVPETE